MSQFQNEKTSNLRIWKIIRRR